MYFKSLSKLFNLLSPKTKRATLLILFSLILIGVIELLTIIFLLPLLSGGNFNFALKDVSSMDDANITVFAINLVIKFFKIKNIFDYSLFLLLFMILKHVVVLGCNYFQYRIIFANDIWLRDHLLNKYLEYSYIDYFKVNSGELIRNTAEQVGQISYGALFSLLIIFSEFLISVFLLFFLLTLLDFSFVLVILTFFFIAFSFYWIFFKRVITKLGQVRYNSIEKTILEIQNIHNLFTEIKLYQLQNYFLRRVKSHSEEFSNSQTKYTFISVFPKSIIELLMVLIILLLVIFLSDTKDFYSQIILVVATIIRISPSYTRISSSLSQLKFSFAQIDALNEVLKIKLFNSFKSSESKKILFANKIDIVNLSFNYEDLESCLNNVSFEIEKGQFVIIKGPSGTGKSTLMKLVMGLLIPKSGQILIDGLDIKSLDLNDWHKLISYVPQKPIIIEGSLVENICLGADLEKVDYDKFNRVLSLTNISDLYESLKGVTLSESGKSISGGQAQRISIARALYRDPEIIFLDEPTSSLDVQNSEFFMSNLKEYAKNSNLTVVIITHSNEFNSYADKIISI